ncbi:MAG: hypothetical protein LBS19_13800 [Clostridiales bacterium]|jgi:hypothetical protein|nr:hypothetical protein [Clostridiales bacterium]
MEPLVYLNERIKDFESVIIYRKGEAGKAILMRLLQHDIKVECFADPNPGEAERILNIPVLHIRDQAVLDMAADTPVIVWGLGLFQAAEELKKLGFRHIFYELAGPDFIQLERGDVQEWRPSSTI